MTPQDLHHMDRARLEAAHQAAEMKLPASWRDKHPHWEAHLRWKAQEVCGHVPEDTQ